MHAGCGECFARNFVVCRFSQEAGACSGGGPKSGVSWSGEGGSLLRMFGRFSLNVANFLYICNRINGTTPVFR